MKLPNWFRIGWWAVLLLLTSVVILRRYDAIDAGTTQNSDLLLIVIWFALALAPIFQEIKLPGGIALKQKLEELKSDVSALRQAISNSVEFRAQFNPTINVPAPPPDAQLPAIEARLVPVLEEVLARHGLPAAGPPTAPKVPDDALYLFGVRYEIERELNRIWKARMEPDQFRRPPSGLQMARSLAEEGLLDPPLVGALRDVYAVASAAIHGESVTEAKVSFVRDLSPQLLIALRAVE